MFINNTHSINILKIIVCLENNNILVNDWWKIQVHRYIFELQQSSKLTISINVSL